MHFEINGSLYKRSWLARFKWNEQNVFTYAWKRISREYINSYSI